MFGYQSSYQIINKGDFFLNFIGVVLKYLSFHCFFQTRIMKEGYGKPVITSVRHCYIL